MEPTIEKTPNYFDHEKDKQLAGVWQENYQKAILELLSEDQPVIDHIIDVIFEKGILEHVAPSDPEVLAARKKLGKEIWSEDRDDSELYWRILYSIYYAKTAIRKKYTLTGANSQVVAYACGKIMSSEKKVQILGDIEDGDVFYSLFDKIENKTKKILEEKSGKKISGIVELGVKGKFYGIPVKVSRYSIDGLISLQAENENDHMRLGKQVKELTGEYSNVIPPSLLNSDNFELILENDEK